MWESEFPILVLAISHSKMFLKSYIIFKDGTNLDGTCYCYSTIETAHGHVLVSPTRLYTPIDPTVSYTASRWAVARLGRASSYQKDWILIASHQHYFSSHCNPIHIHTHDSSVRHTHNIVRQFYNKYKLFDVSLPIPNKT